MVYSCSPYHLFPLVSLGAPLYLGYVTSPWKPSVLPPPLERGLLAFPLNTASLGHILAAHCKRKTPVRCENEHRTSKVAKIIQDAICKTNINAQNTRQSSMQMVSSAAALHAIPAHHSQTQGGGTVSPTLHSEACSLWRMLRAINP